MSALNEISKEIERFELVYHMHPDRIVLPWQVLDDALRECPNLGVKGATHVFGLPFSVGRKLEARFDEIPGFEVVKR